MPSRIARLGEPKGFRRLKVRYLRGRWRLRGVLKFDGKSYRIKEAAEKVAKRAVSA